MGESGRLGELCGQIALCHICVPHLPLGPRPVVRASRSARLLVIGQAPGRKVHASGVPWDDASGRAGVGQCGQRIDIYSKNSLCELIRFCNLYL